MPDVFAVLMNCALLYCGTERIGLLNISQARSGISDGSDRGSRAP